MTLDSPQTLLLRSSESFKPRTYAAAFSLDPLNASGICFQCLMPSLEYQYGSFFCRDSGITSPYPNQTLLKVFMKVATSLTGPELEKLFREMYSSPLPDPSFYKLYQAPVLTTGKRSTLRTWLYLTGRFLFSEPCRHQMRMLEDACSCRSLPL